MTASEQQLEGKGEVSSVPAVAARSANGEQAALLREAESILAELLGGIDDGVVPESGEFEALGDVILDAILAQHQPVLARIVTDVRTAESSVERQPHRNAIWQRIAGRLEALLALAMAASDRLLSTLELAAIQPNGRAHRLLEEVRKSGLIRGQALAEALKMGDQQLSRLTSDLTRSRLLIRTKLGREVFWEISPRGDDILSRLAERIREADASAHAARRARTPAIWTRATAGAVVQADNKKPVRWEPDLLGPSLRRSGRIDERSRAFFASLIALHPRSVTDRLAMWGSLQRFGDSQPLELRLVPPSVDYSDIERLTLDVLIEVNPTFQRFEDLDWPAPPPLWDGWAIVNGRHGRRGIIFLEAKSQPEELKSFPFKAGTAVTDDDELEKLVAATGEELNTGQRWSLDAEYRDPMMRLAFIHNLREIGIDAWWLNAYFVDPTQTFSKLPASEETWHVHIDHVKRELGTSPEVRRLIKDDFFQVPDETRELVTA